MLIDILEPMGAQFDRLRCEVCQNLFLSPMNTGLLRHAVATVLTVYGIETLYRKRKSWWPRCWVATVLTVYGIETVNNVTICFFMIFSVATVLTVYGIETTKFNNSLSDSVLMLQQCLPFTVLKLQVCFGFRQWFFLHVATVLTVMIYVADCEVEAAQRNDEISILQLSIQIEGK